MNSDDIFHPFGESQKRSDFHLPFTYLLYIEKEGQSI